ncbi:molybdopterin-dependent oxidoreductase [Haloarchaeobius litoreus]|uniref:Molybdopterin-dependent oxidoreductase n=1 Tax=Haloarchaeobius litoreus TaxID=755306 RepID=A0ABD6DNJ2_9EURY|nr:molybdopterin-dependent oxidoreductase [Haloarchaeobius litoreus]
MTGQDSSAADGRDRTTADVLVDGETPRSLDALLSTAGVGTVERTLGYDCLSRGLVDATWRGVPVRDLVEAVGLPDETTHLLVESRDGHRGCVPIGTALDGLLALERDGEPLSGPRFLAPQIEGPRAVKDVARLEPVALAPHEDRTAYETTGGATDDGD